MSGTSLLLIEPDQKTGVFMQHMFTRAGYDVQVVPSGKEGLILAWRDLPDIIVTEMDLADIEAVELVRKLRQDQRTKRSMIIGLTHLSNPQLSADGMEAGLDHFIVKQADAVEMLMRFIRESHIPEDHSGETPPRPPGNQLIAFLGAKGGVGTSSMCINTAHHIGLKAGADQTLLCDLVLPLGSLRWISGARQPLELVELTQLPSSDLSHSFLNDRMRPPQGWAFHLLAGMLSPKEAASVMADRIAPLLQFFRTRFAHIVVDLGRNVSALARVVMSQADRLVIVLQADEECVSNALAIRDFLFSNGIAKGQIWFVSNRPIASEGLTTEALAGRIGDSLAAALPNIQEQLALVNALHAPIQLRFPEQKINLTIERLADQLLSGELQRTASPHT